jgi:hypothetical protein
MPLGTIELQRLRATGIMPRGVQLYVAACPQDLQRAKWRSISIAALRAFQRACVRR